jgi:CheY-like chemotaxis protein
MSTPVLVVASQDARRKESFVSALSQAGWETTVSASSVTEVARLARAASNACVVIDAELADMPGLKAVEILRDLCPHIKIIFTTQQNTRDLEAQLRGLGVFYYYVDSGDTTELIAAVKAAIGPARHGKARDRAKLLIVDDDDGFHGSIRAILESEGYDTLSAYSQREGLDMARREQPDVILLDIIMGSTTDGFEFCREAKRDPQIKHTPILGISAIEDRLGLGSSLVTDSELFPVDGYLRKPVAPEQLFAELRRLMPREG